MRLKDQKLANKLDNGLVLFEESVASLPGLQQDERRAVFIAQCIDSLRRVSYIRVVSEREISSERADPASDLFDPIRAAIVQMRKGQIEEAFWLVFLFVHFGKSSTSGWKLIRDIYGSLDGSNWDWVAVSAKPNAFSRWLARNYENLKGGGRSFGNHRKYETLRPSSKNNTGAVVESYVGWVLAFGNHENLVMSALDEADNDPERAFNILFRSMSAVLRFGRTAKFDYLAMIGKLGLAPIEPDLSYMSGATGPLKGARLLFNGDSNAKSAPAELERRLGVLDDHLGMGKQALEDALCNWQKSPENFMRFRG